MFAKSNVVLSAAVVLGLFGGARPALAGYNYEGPYGGPRQTWCDVNPDCNGWNKAHGPAYQSSASGLVTPLDPQHRPPHKRHPANDR